MNFYDLTHFSCENPFGSIIRKHIIQYYKQYFKNFFLRSGSDCVGLCAKLRANILRKGKIPLPSRVLIIISFPVMWQIFTITWLSSCDVSTNIMEPKLLMLNFKKNHKHLLEFSYELRIIDELRDGLFHGSLITTPIPLLNDICFFEINHVMLTNKQQYVTVLPSLWTILTDPTFQNTLDVARTCKQCCRSQSWYTSVI